MRSAKRRFHLHSSSADAGPFWKTIVVRSNLALEAQQSFYSAVVVDFLFQSIFPINSENDKC